MKTDNSPLQLLYSGHYGIYMPQFAANELPFTEPLTDEQKSDLSSPDNEFYWETWEDVLGKSLTEPSTGFKYFLHMDDDLWAIREGYSMTENGELIEDKTGNKIEI